MRIFAWAWYAGSERLSFHFFKQMKVISLYHTPVENWKVLVIYEKKKNPNLETRYQNLSLNFVYLIIDIFNKIAGRLLDKMRIKVIDFNFINAITFSVLSTIQFCLILSFVYYWNSSSYLVKSPHVVWRFFRFNAFIRILMRNCCKKIFALPY